ncbi:reverse transcriptase [Corchorus capsularis]|uniref:Reverse transcriptase n=1 Tax=Corchorus capsularis TaxID=210143 RepID=A0A1R3HP15_COCAP|nr:reverse transcriptase [Corchorus capsularis]
MCSRLSLQSEGGDEVVVQDQDWLGGSEGDLAWFHLISRLFSKQKANVDRLRTTMLLAWQVEVAFMIKEAGDNLFIFHFEDEVERDRILVSQPWCFNRTLLVLKDFDGIQVPTEGLWILTHLDSDCPVGVTMLKTQGYIEKKFDDSIRAKILDAKPRQSGLLARSRMRVSNQGMGNRGGINQLPASSISGNSQPRALRNHVDSQLLRRRIQFTNPFCFWGDIAPSPGRRQRNWKKKARITSKYTFDVLGPCTNADQKIGQKQNSGIPNYDFLSAGANKKWKERGMMLDNQEGDEFGAAIYRDLGAVDGPTNTTNSGASGDRNNNHKSQSAGMEENHPCREPLIFLFGTTEALEALGQCFPFVPMDFIPRKDFRFEHMWIKHDGLEEVIRESWNQNPMLDVKQSIEACGRVLQFWNKSVFGNVRHKINCKQRELENLYVDIQQQDGPQAIQNCVDELNVLYDQEEIMWRQQSKENYFGHVLCLDREFTKEEIRQAAFNMDPDKAAGADGMSPLFFNVFGILWIDNPISVKDFRHISLFNVIFKIISKALVNWLKEILPQIISQTQSAFVPGRMVFDSAMVAFETVHYLKNKRHGVDGYMALKLDLSKAYDKVEQDFLDSVMRQIGFSKKWILMVMNCVKTVSYSFLINGDQTKKFMPTRGIRQGDPLSPYLFLLCMEGLSCLSQLAGPGSEPCR